MSDEKVKKATTEDNEEVAEVEETAEVAETSEGSEVKDAAEETGVSEVVGASEGSEGSKAEGVKASGVSEGSRTGDGKASRAETGKVEKSEKKKVSPVWAALGVALALGLIGGAGAMMLGGNKQEEPKAEETPAENPVTAGEMEFDAPLSSQLHDFDLSFLKLENEEKNKVYSPLSIRYALGMLADAAEGESKAQITNVIGNYVPKSYSSNKNMSFANAMFVSEAYKSLIKSSYTDNLVTKFSAGIIYDPFTTATTVNSWVKDKTLGLIGKLFTDGDVQGMDFVLVNALAIDMEWNKKIQSVDTDYVVSWKHIDYNTAVGDLMSTGMRKLEFGEAKKAVSGLSIAAVANRYDILNDLGADNIKATVKEKYEEWLKGDKCGTPDFPDTAEYPDVETYLGDYMRELGNGGFGDVSSSTDFRFYVDEDVKVFAKDLKEYGGTTLQYVGIMPTKTALKDYVANAKAADVIGLTQKLKTIELGSFKDGVITEITGTIPVFDFNYTLELGDDLERLGIHDVFDKDKADLSAMTTDETAYINVVKHMANIDFSNDGIKAAAVTAVGGKGAGGCGFDHRFEVPVEKIDLTFDKPYMFLIRDKDSGEVWFTGTVYEPKEYVSEY